MHDKREGNEKHKQERIVASKDAPGWFFINTLIPSKTPSFLREFKGNGRCAPSCNISFIRLDSNAPVHFRLEMTLAQGIAAVFASVQRRFAADGARASCSCHIFEENGCTFKFCIVTTTFATVDRFAFARTDKLRKELLRVTAFLSTGTATQGYRPADRCSSPPLSVQCTWPRVATVSSVLPAGTRDRGLLRRPFCPAP